MCKFPLNVQIFLLFLPMLITLLICYTGRQEKCNFIWQLFISIVYISTVNSKILTILCSRHARKIALFQGFIPLKKGHSHKLHITVTFLVSSGLQMTMMKQSIDVFFYSCIQWITDDFKTFIIVVQSVEVSCRS